MTTTLAPSTALGSSFQQVPGLAAVLHLAPHDQHLEGAQSAAVPNLTLHVSHLAAVSERWYRDRLAPIEVPVLCE
jgi:hypothetical protein